MAGAITIETADHTTVVLCGYGMILVDCAMSPDELAHSPEQFQQDDGSELLAGRLNGDSVAGVTD